MSTPTHKTQWVDDGTHTGPNGLKVIKRKFPVNDRSKYTPRPVNGTPRPLHATKGD